MTTLISNEYKLKTPYLATNKDMYNRTENYYYPMHALEIRMLKEEGITNNYYLYTNYIIQARFTNYKHYDQWATLFKSRDKEIAFDLFEKIKNN